MFNNYHQYLSSKKTLVGGVALRFTFPNGYTGSVIRHLGSYGHAYGLWEIDVMHGNEFVYDTPITDDFIGWLTNEEVEHILQQIRELPPRK